MAVRKPKKQVTIFGSLAKEDTYYIFFLASVVLTHPPTNVILTLSVPKTDKWVIPKMLAVPTLTYGLEIPHLTQTQLDHLDIEGQKSN